MADLPEVNEWPEGIYQLETSDPVLGGPEGIDNLQGKQLASRTKWLRDQLDKIVNGVTAIGKATQLLTPRALKFKGAVTGNGNFDGSADLEITLTLASSGVAAGSYPKVTVNDKGVVTEGGTLDSGDIPALDWGKIASGKPTTLSGYGIVLPTKVQAEAGTDNALPMTPLRVFEAISAKVIQATEALVGIAKVATQVITDAGTDDAAFVTPKKLAQRLTTFGALAGFFSNGRMSIATESAAATFSADEISVKGSLGGACWLLPSFSKTINLAITGAGGMDTGTAPASGFVSIYAIYNPTTRESALLACNQTVSSGRVYIGANMPAGYTASALVSVWGTTATRLLVAGFQVERQINVPLTNINSSTVNQTSTPISVASIVPLAAKEIAGLLQCGSSAASNATMALSGTANQIGARNLGASVAAGTVVQGSFSGLSLGTSTTVYYTANATSGALSSTAYLSSYSI